MNRELDSVQVSFGFSPKGLVVLLLPMVPNLLFLVLPNPNVARAGRTDHRLLDALEHGSQGASAVLLIFVVGRFAAPILSGLTISMALLLLVYLELWVAYFTVGATFPMLMFMAIVPTIYLLLAAVWLHNPPALAFTAIFGAAHMAITYLDYHQPQH